MSYLIIVIIMWILIVDIFTRHTRRERSFKLILSTLISSYDQFLSDDHCYNIVNHCLQHYQLQPLQLLTAKWMHKLNPQCCAGTVWYSYTCSVIKDDEVTHHFFHHNGIAWYVWCPQTTKRDSILPIQQLIQLWYVTNVMHSLCVTSSTLTLITN